jgi:hypothetical protein
VPEAETPAVDHATAGRDHASEALPVVVRVKDGLGLLLVGGRQHGKQLHRRHGQPTSHGNMDELLDVEALAADVLGQVREGDLAAVVSDSASSSSTGMSIAIAKASGIHSQGSGRC